MTGVRVNGPMGFTGVEVGGVGLLVVEGSQGEMCISRMWFRGSCGVRKCTLLATTDDTNEFIMIIKRGTERLKEYPGSTVEMGRWR